MVFLSFIASPLCTGLQVFPVFYSFKALRSGNTVDLHHWLTYWIVQSVLYVMESLLIFLLGWVPFFYEIKLIATVWMISPHSKLVKILYTNGIEALLVDNEERFDALAAKGTRQFFMVLHNMIGVIIRLLQTEVKSDASMGLKTL
eukprot:TRINITY_DN3730_c0_g1_i13.p1 TRINITY_DN3730_c0_g1~~TRINITY_DN3730_c0_g1_i13.p1  ORF type:complete len:145 (-),score=26.76 TRINITY_DN3730_c0_g1_i13:412-846(-)